MAAKKTSKAGTAKGATRKPNVAKTPVKQPGTKGGQIVQLLRRASGATIDELIKATGWQAHSVRGFMSGDIKKKQGLLLKSEKIEGRGRVYSLPRGA